VRAFEFVCNMYVHCLNLLVSNMYMHHSFNLYVFQSVHVFESLCCVSQLLTLIER
jgi:hypothetical protein